MISDNDHFIYNNEDEGDMAQLHSIHHHLNRIAAIRRQIPNGKSKTHCEECGEPIPEKRQEAIPGCKTCVSCQSEIEKKG